MNIDAQGKKYQTSILGASLTLFMYAIVGVYTVQQIIIMVEKKNIDMVTATSEYFFSETDVFNEQMGLKFAVAFTGYDNIQEYDLPPEIGELVFTTYEWGPDESGGLFINNDNLNTHVCTAEELSLTDGKSTDSSHKPFFKIHE